MINEPIVFYHADCFDGFTAAWITRRRYPNAIMKPAEYGKTVLPGNLTGEDVICLDFSWKRPEMTHLSRITNSLLVLDHHASAEIELKGIEGCFFDLTKSGAMMAWEHFNPNHDPPPLVSYVEDRDLWHWALPKSKEINAAIGSYPMTWDSWNRLAMSDVELLGRDGTAILRDQAKQVDQALRVARVGSFGDKTAAMVNSSLFQSEIGNALCEMLRVEVGVVWSQDETGGYRYSLRASKYGINVHTIAAKYGGGGHPRAAGFLSNTLLDLDK